MKKILFVPGLLGDESLWQPIIQLLGREYACQVIDISGDFSIEQLAQNLWRDINDDVIIIGFSFGAWIALQACLMNPQQCSALVLISSAPGNLKAPTRERFSAYINQISSGEFEAFLQEDFEQDVASENKSDKELKSALLDMMRKQGPEVAIRQLNSMLKFTGDFSNLTKVRCPTLLLRGACDISINSKRQDEICQEIEQAELKIIEDTAHYIPLENPKAMAKAIQEWLQVQSFMTN